jgi:hypothetical protein
VPLDDKLRRITRAMARVVAHRGAAAGGPG